MARFSLFLKIHVPFCCNHSPRFYFFFRLHAELFHTERSHVRNLKVLDRVFYRPLLDNGFSDLVNLLFPNLPDMLEIHGRFNTLMKARKRDQPAVETVGDILVAMVIFFYIVIIFFIT